MPKKIYKKCKIIEICLINKTKILVDALIKKNGCDILKRFININIISVKALGWIERKKSSKKLSIQNETGKKNSENDQLGWSIRMIKSENWYEII